MSVKLNIHVICRVQYFLSTFNPVLLPGLYCCLGGKEHLNFHGILGGGGGRVLISYCYVSDCSLSCTLHLPLSPHYVRGGKDDSNYVRICRRISKYHLQFSERHLHHLQHLFGKYVEGCNDSLNVDSLYIACIHGLSWDQPV